MITSPHQPLRSAFVAICFVFFAVTTLSAATYNVSTPAQFNSAASAVNPGDEIVIANGTYNNWGTLSINRPGTFASPILIRPATPHGVTFTGNVTFELRGQHLHFRDFRFYNATNDRVVHLIDTAHCRVSGNLFINCGNTTSTAQILRASSNTNPAGSAYHRFDFNVFEQTRGGSIVVTVPDTPAPVGGTLVDHNLFREIPRVLSNGGEAISYYADGKHTNIHQSGLAMYNVFDRADGDDEIITNKSGGNVYFRNIFAWSSGGMSLRRENDCRFDSNLMLGGTQGLSLHGLNHTVVNNVFQDLGAWPILMSNGGGNPATDGEIAWVATQGSVIAHNTLLNNGGSNINFRRSSPFTGSAAQNNIIAHNIVSSNRDQAVLLNQNHGQIALNTISNNLFHPTSPATQGNTVAGNLNNTNPQLTGSADALHIAGASPARDAATSLAVVQQDSFGGFRPVSSARDIGHHEFNPASVAPTSLLPPVPDDRIGLGYTTQPLQADLRIFPRIQRVGEPVLLDAANSRGPVVSWQFETSDGRVYQSTDRAIPHRFTQAGVHTVTLQVANAAGVSSTVTDQVVILEPAPAAPFVIGDRNLLVAEAENFYENIPRGDHAWSDISFSGASGGTVMEVGPDNGTTRNSAPESVVAELTYRFHFPHAGRYYLWLRATSPNTAADSIHAGLNGVLTTAGTNIALPGSALAWHNTNAASDRVFFDVTSAGLHTVSLWLREDGARIDKLLLTTNKNYIPSGLDVPESPRAVIASDLAAAPELAPITVPGAATLALSWSDVPDAEGYTVQRRTANGGWSTLASALPSSTTSFQDNGLNSFSTYFYRVAALFDGQPGLWSAERSGTTLAGALDAPPDLNAVPATGPQRVLLSWTDIATAETGYRVERRLATPADSAWSTVATLPDNATSATDTTVAAGIEYIYRVIATDGAQSGPPSNEARAITHATHSTPDTLLVNALPGETKTASVTLRNPSSVPQTYTLSLSDPAVISHRRSDQVGGPAYVWNDIVATGTVLPTLKTDMPVSIVLPIGFEFPFLGKTYDTFTLTNRGFLSFGPIYDVPNSHQSLAQLTAGLPDPIIAFAWTHLRYLSDGNIYYHNPDPDTLVIQYENAASFLESPANRMTLQVVLKSDGDIFIYCKNFTLSPGADISLGIQDYEQGIHHFIANNKTYLTSNLAIHIDMPEKWLSLPVTEVHLAPGEEAQIDLDVSTVGLPLGLREMDLQVASSLPWQPAFNVPVTLNISETPPPTAPSGLTVGSSTSSSLTINWSDNSGNETGFEIQRSPDGNTNWTLIHTTSANTTTWTNPGLLAATTYHYRIRAINGSSVSDWSAPAFATTTVSSSASQLFTFDTPGDHTAPFTRNGTDHWQETNGAGLAGTRALTAEAGKTINGSSWNTSLNGADTRTLSILFQWRTSATNGGQPLFLGLGPDPAYVATLGASPAGDASNYHIYVSLDKNGTTTANQPRIRISNRPNGSNSAFTNSAYVGSNLIDGRWYQLRMVLTHNGGGSYAVQGFLDDHGPTGAAFVGNVLSVTNNALINTALAADPTTHVFFGGQNAYNRGIAALDNLLITNTPGGGETELTPLEQWLTNAGLPLDTDLTLDPSGGGTPLLLRYALGLDPSDPTAPSDLPLLGTTPEQLTLTFTPAVLSGLTYHIEASSDLSDWTETYDITPLLTEDQPYTHTDPEPIADHPSRFLRLRVTLP